MMQYDITVDSIICIYRTIIVATGGDLHLNTIITSPLMKLERPEVLVYRGAQLLAKLDDLRRVL